MSDSSLTLGAIVSDTQPAQFPGPEPLIGQYVTAERLEQKHFSDLYEHLCLHPAVWEWWPDDAPSTSALFDDYLNRLLVMSPDVVVYAVLPLSGPHEGRALGLALAQSEDRSTSRVGEVGMFFGPDLQRTRAGTEVPYLLVRLLFELNHRRVAWRTNSLNQQSRRAAERYGFVYEGLFRQHKIDKGRNRDTVWYSIIDPEWPVCKEAFEKWLEAGNFDEEERQRLKLEEIREGLKVK